MGENKGQTIFLSVIGIATLLVAIIGATFAYFTTTMSETSSTASSVTTAQVANITMTGAQLARNGETDVLPGTELGYMTVTVAADTLPATTINYPYTCTVFQGTTANDSESQVFPVSYKVSSADTGTDNTTSNDMKTVYTKLYVLGGVEGARTYTRANGTFTGSLTHTNQSDAYHVDVRYDEVGDIQNPSGDANQANKTINVRVTCELTGGTKYYTYNNPNGSNDPAAANMGANAE